MLSMLAGISPTWCKIAFSEQFSLKAEAVTLLQTRCQGCHGSEKQEGGLRLDSVQALKRGGDSRSPLLQNDQGPGEILRRITSSDKHERMPPSGDRLTEGQVDLLRRWLSSSELDQWSIAEGATPDPKLDHWAWKPIRRPSIPPTLRSSWCRTEIDHFVLHRLESEGIAPSELADARTLIRRLSFDLLGLPPTPDEVVEFQRGFHEDPHCYEALVDRYLASPRYGERWARHWLDVVHYGDTHGYDKDKPRPNAWPYRDYVIRALNEDKPYAQFIEEQLAGDAICTRSRDGIVALGFISAGPWDFIGHAEVAESKIDGKIARHLDRDDMVGNALGTFCSLTVQCAQCHNHKFDPISQEDYYSLQAVFAALDRADREYFDDPNLTEKHDQLKRERLKIANELKELDAAVRKRAGKKLELLEEQINEQKKNAKGNLKPEFGFHSAIASRASDAKWIQFDFGKPIDLQGIVLFPCYDDFNRIGAGFGFPIQYRIDACDDESFGEKSVRLVSRDDRDYENPKLKPQTFAVAGRFRFIRITATKLATRSNDHNFALAEVQVFDDAGNNIAPGAKLSALDSIESPPRWKLVNLTDGLWPVEKDPQSIESLEVQRDQMRAEYFGAAMAERESILKRRMAEMDAQWKSFPSANVVYSATIHSGSGAFVGTGAQGGRPRSIRILHRGSVEHPGREVSAGAVEAFSWSPGRFELPADHDESARRLALAKWITHPQNPLTWRSIANRVWQYHFGRGLVETSNDFGRMGAMPSHPELLDWLASELVDYDQSIKRLHKKIVMSATYMQTSRETNDVSAESNLSFSNTDKRAANDADNRLLWRQNRRKLEAEAIRDSVLYVAGSLHFQMGGPGYQDFVIEHPEHSPHYEYDKANPDDTKTWRRSVYRFVVRSQTQPWMTTLDCPDPSIRIDRRNESQSPLQALSLLNNGMILVQAKHFAERIRQQADHDQDEQLRIACRRALQRDLQREEYAWMKAFNKEHGLENLCRVLFNLNEFIFID